MDIDKILRKLKTLISKISPDAKTILYGSYARGDSNQDSDIDLLVLLPDSLTPDQFVQQKINISGQLYDFSLANKVDVSPLILVPKVFYARKTPFTINVINEGIEI